MEIASTPPQPKQILPKAPSNTNLDNDIMNGAFSGESKRSNIFDLGPVDIYKPLIPVRPCVFHIPVLVSSFPFLVSVFHIQSSVVLRLVAAARDCVPY